MPVVLAVFGLGLLLAAFGAYRHAQRPEPPAPAFGYVAIQGSSSVVDATMAHIIYAVDQLHPDLARVTVQVLLDSGSSPGDEALVTLSQLGAATVTRCSPSCSEDSGHWNAKPYFDTYSTATAYFFVKARSFAVAANGATAEAAFPALGWTGTTLADLRLQYHIPGANTYDWSSTPALTLTSSSAVWTEPVNPATGFGSYSGITQPRVASGINHAAQQGDSDLTLLAGLLFGIGGSALVAAVQEALHD